MLQNLGNSQREGGLGVVAGPDRLDYAFRILQDWTVWLFRSNVSPRLSSF
jgi:hypothetical protein